MAGRCGRIGRRSGRRAALGPWCGPWLSPWDGSDFDGDELPDKTGPADVAELKCTLDQAVGFVAVADIKDEAKRTDELSTADTAEGGQCLLWKQGPQPAAGISAGKFQAALAFAGCRDEGRFCGREPAAAARCVPTLFGMIELR